MSSLTSGVFASSSPVGLPAQVHNSPLGSGAPADPSLGPFCEAAPKRNSKTGSEATGT